MKKLFFVLALVVIAVSACGSPAPVATEPPTAAPPTAVPPTVAPTAVPIDEKEVALQELVQKFMDEGRISSADGEYIPLDDYSVDNNELVYYNDAVTGGVDIPANFVYSGHFKWSSAADSNDPSGCGLVFAGQENGSHYALFLDQDQIYFLRSDASSGSSQAWVLGKAAGTGTVSFGNPAEADFSLAVNGNSSYVYVDGEFVGQYDLVKDSPTQGKFGYSIISGTAKDYGVHCEITNGAVWALK